MSDFKAKMHQIRLPLGSAPDPAQRSPDLLAVFKGPSSKPLRGGRGKGREREGNGEEKGRLGEGKGEGWPLIVESGSVTVHRRIHSLSTRHSLSPGRTFV